MLTHSPSPTLVAVRRRFLWQRLRPSDDHTTSPTKEEPALLIKNWGASVDGS
jgi:hypothetical protein